MRHLYPNKRPVAILEESPPAYAEKDPSQELFFILNKKILPLIYKLSDDIKAFQAAPEQQGGAFS